MNKLINQKTYFPSWYAYNSKGEYVGRIEKDQQGIWYVVNTKGNRAMVESFQEARIEARDHLK